MSANSPTRVAVLGAGIMGSSLALFLARRGVRVTLVDRAGQAFSGASRWNEGKIHLGYLYSGDSSGETARRLIPGGLAFKRLVGELVGSSLDGEITPGDDIYLVHRRSVADVTETAAYFAAVSDAVRGHPDAAQYLVDGSASRTHALTPRELAALADTSTLIAGFRVPERSVRTTWIADRFVTALAAESGIEQAMSTAVTAARPVDGSPHGQWRVLADPPLDPTYDVVVNALWEGRLAVDATAGLEPAGRWSHRFRLSLFLRSERELDVPSAVVATGPFGDVKNYNGRDLYCSWYPTGLLAEGDAIDPPRFELPTGVAGDRLADEILTKLGALVYPVREIGPATEARQLAGGWVFAQGGGSLADPRATLHRRDRFGVARLGNYISVDTGKYSTAPWLARELADQITAASFS